MKTPENITLGIDEYKQSITAMTALLDERQRRFYLATQAKMIGRGGITLISNLSGINRDTISDAIKEFDRLVDNDAGSPNYGKIQNIEGTTNEGKQRIRKSGAGRKSLQSQQPQLVDALLSIVRRDNNYGDPEGRILEWISKSTRNIAEAMQELGVAYAYCMMMDETRDYVMYVTDIERDSIADFLDTDYPNAIETDSSELTDEEISDYAKYIYVHWMGPNPREKYPFLWQTWDAGKALDGYQEWNNEFGHTYAYYTPIVIDGQKLGIVAAEIEVDRVNKEILSNSLMQILLVCVILFLGLIISVTLINSRYISRLSRIDSAVRGYTLNHDQDAVEKIEKNIKGNEEISSLGRGLVTMITEIDNYIKQLTQSKAETMALKELANKDSLTGINNKTAYDVEIDRLQFEMDHGLLNSYGIAVADLNYLKRINDNYGHEKGNIAIKNICSIICRIFSHSPVFRIGGDEFVVILKGEDLEHINELMTKFKSTVDEIYNDTSLENWERVSAAIGYAVYDPKLDSKAESVFQRADAAMYQNKKEMKALM